MLNLPQDFPITTGTLLTSLKVLQLPSLLKRGMLGLTQQKTGRFRADQDIDDMARLVYAPTAILLRFIATTPDLALPLIFPTPREFLKTLMSAFPTEPDLQEISLPLGLEKSAASRWKRGLNSRPYTAAQVLMALITADPDRIAERWQIVTRMATLEAELRGIDLATAGSWGDRPQAWIPRLNKGSHPNIH